VGEWFGVTPNFGSGVRAEREDKEDFPDKLAFRLRECEGDDAKVFVEFLGIRKEVVSVVICALGVAVGVDRRCVLLRCRRSRSGDGDRIGDRGLGDKFVLRAFNPPECAILFTFERTTSPAEGVGD